MTQLTLEKALERTEEVVKRVISPNAEKIDKDAVWPEEGIRALQDDGLGSLVVSKE